MEEDWSQYAVVEPMKETTDSAQGAQTDDKAIDSEDWSQYAVVEPMKETTDSAQGAQADDKDIDSEDWSQYAVVDKPKEEVKTPKVELEGASFEVVEDKESDFWGATKDFFKDIAELPFDFYYGGDDLQRQMRLIKNYYEGDNEELDRLIVQGGQSKLHDNRTMVSGWLRSAAKTLPYLLTSGSARLGAFAAGSLATPAVGVAAGISAGAAVGYAQGWGEIFENLVNAGVEKEDAASIANVGAALYAGLELAQVGAIMKVLGLGKFASVGISQSLFAKLKKSPELSKKIAGILGEDTWTVIKESLEEGAQGMVLNASQQYGENGGFNDFDIVENLKRGGTDFIESMGPFAVIHGAAKGINRLATKKKTKESDEEKIEDKNPVEDMPFKKREFDKEIGTPSGVTQEIPQSMQESVIWATTFTPKDYAEMKEDAANIAKGEIENFKKQNPDASAEDVAKFADTSFRQIYTAIAVKAHDYKLALADLDKGEYSFEKVFASKIRKVGSAQVQNSAEGKNLPSQSVKAKIENVSDEPLSEREQRNVEKFNENIQSGSAKLNILNNEAYKQSGLNCGNIVVTKTAMDRAQALGIDISKIAYELIRPVAIVKENPRIKQIRILTSLNGKQDKQVCFQGNINNDNLIVLDDILGYRQEAIEGLLNEEMRYINKEKVRLLKESRLKSGASSQLNEPSLDTASEYSKPSQAKYSKKLEKVMNEADAAFETKKDKVVDSLKKMGLEVTEQKTSKDKSQYIDVHLDNGEKIYVRVSDHPAKTRIDVSIEKDWKAGTRFIYEQVFRGDWGTETNPNWQGDARRRFLIEKETRSQEPTSEEIAEAKRQREEVKAKWTNSDGTMKKGYHLAPNGKPSKLTEEQWLLVRTPNFKKWFGDWEALAIINEIKEMPAMEITLHEALDKAGIKEAFKAFGEVENKHDGRIVAFPVKSAGKIHYHKGFNTSEVIRNFKSLFETSIPIISEKEILKEGHKVHGNIESYEHYINKFSANGNEYFIRFTVPVIHNNKGSDNVHSSAISEVSIYKNGDSTLTLIQTPGSSSPSFVDTKLADFLKSVKPEDVSKVVDENGEPSELGTFDESNPNMQYKNAVGGEFEGNSAEEDFDVPTQNNDVGAGVLNKSKNVVGKSYESFDYKPTLIPDLQLPSRVRRGKIAGVSDIRKWFSIAFGLPITNEADTGMRASGYYDTRSDTIHIAKRSRNELATLFHEIGHALDERFFNGRLRVLQNRLSDELYDFFKYHGDERGVDVSAYRDSDYVSEGWAEFCTDFVLNPRKAQKACPIAFEVLTEKIKQEKGVGAIFKKLADMLKARAKASQAELDEARIVSALPEKFKLPLRFKIRAFYRWMSEYWTDKGAYLEDLQKKLNKLAPNSNFKFDDLRKNFEGGSLGQSEFSLSQAQVDLNGKIVGKGLAEILKPISVDELGEFNMFLVARRIVGMGRQKGFNAYSEFADLSREIVGFEFKNLKRYYENAPLKYRQVAMGLDEFNKNSLELLVAGGVIPRTLAKRWKNNIGYIPFRRLMEVDGAGEPVGRVSVDENSPIHKMRGSNREIIDPLSVIAENAAIFRTLACKNRIKRDLVKGCGQLKGFGSIAERDIERSKATKIEKEAAAIAIYEAGFADDVLGYDTSTMKKDDVIKKIVDEIDESNPAYNAILWAKSVKADEKNMIMTVFENGQRVAYKFHDKDAYKALLHLDETTSRIFEKISKLISPASNVMKVGATSNIAFSLSNFIRDNAAAMVYSKTKSGFVPIVTTLAKGLAPALLKNRSGTYKEWVASGGYNSNFVGESESLDIHRILNKSRGAKGRIRNLREDLLEKPISTVIKTPFKIATMPLQALSEIFESATRLAEFKGLKDEYIEENGEEAWQKDTQARMDAANSSKQITMNFARKGFVGGEANKMIAFFNAGMQGFSKIFELSPIDVPLALDYLCGDLNVKAKDLISKDGSTRLIRMLVKTSILIAMRGLYPPDDEDEIPEWKKETCWNFDFGNGVVSIPKDYEGLPLYEAMERMLPGDARSRSWLWTMRDIFGFNAVPVVAKPWIEWTTNYSYFRDAPLISKSVENLPKRAQAYPSTSQTAKFLAEKIFDITGFEVSPIILENFNQQHFAGLGKEALWWSDKLGSKLGLWSEGVNSKFKDAPFNPLKKFELNPFAASANVEKFYKLKAEGEGLRSTAKKIQDGLLKSDILTPLEVEKLRWYNLNKTEINQIAKVFTTYNKAIRAVQIDDSLSGEEKDLQIRGLIRAKNDLARRAKSLQYSPEKLRAKLEKIAARNSGYTF